MEVEEAVENIGVGSFWIFTGLIAGMFFQYIVNIFLAHFLGPKVYGVYIQGVSVVSIAGVIALLGLNMGVPRMISYRSSDKGEQLPEKYVTTAFLTVLTTSTVLSLLIFSGSRLLSIELFAEPMLIQPLKILALAIVPYSLFQIFMAFLRGKKNVRHKIIADNIFSHGSNLIFLLFFIGLGFGLMGGVYAYLLSTLATCLFGYIVYSRLSEGFVIPHERIPRKLLVFTWPLFLTSLLFLVSNKLDVVMIGWLMESDKVGIYSVAYGIANVLTFLLIAMEYIFMPAVTEIYGNKNYRQAKQVYATVTRWITGIVLPLVAGIVIFPSEIITLLYGAAYVEGSILLVILSSGFLVSMATGPTGMFLLAAGRNTDYMKGVGLIAASVFILNLLLIPMYGLLGAAISTVSGILLGNLLMLNYVGNEINGLPYNKIFLRMLASAVFASLTVLAIKILLDPGIALSVFLGVILVLIYSVLTYSLGAVRDVDIRVIRKIFRTLLERRKTS